MEKNKKGHKFQLTHFEGPLDLLLFLIRKNEVNIYDIPIAEITEQYLGYLDLSTGIDLENASEFYVTAATLLYIKSRMLLPVEVDFDDDMEDPRQELVAKLIEYQKFKKLSTLMTEKEEEREWIIERKQGQPVLEFSEEDELWEELQVWDLLKCFSHVMKSINNEKIVNLYEEVTVNEKIVLMEEILSTRREFFFQDLLVNPGSVMEIVCSFLAILEQVKIKRILVFQNRLFGDIKLATNPEYKADAS